MNEACPMSSKRLARSASKKGDSLSKGAPTSYSIAYRKHNNEDCEKGDCFTLSFSSSISFEATHGETFDIDAWQMRLLLKNSRAAAVSFLQRTNIAPRKIAVVEKTASLAGVYFLFWMKWDRKSTECCMFRLPHPKKGRSLNQKDANTFSMLGYDVKVMK